MNTSENQTQPEKRESVPATDSDIHSTLDLTTIQEITKFEDEVPPQESIVLDQPNLPLENDPFPSQSLLDFLSRPRAIHIQKWSPTDTFGKCLARLSLPDGLFASSTVWNKIQQFVYLHAGLHFSVRVNGTPFHYGQLMVVWRPACYGRTLHYDPAYTGMYDSMYTLSQYPNMLVSPSSAQVVEMTVPYESPLERIPLAAYSKPLADNYERIWSHLGFLELWVLSPLLGQDPAITTPSVSVTIFANFTNPILSGYTHNQISFVAIEPPTIRTFSTPDSLRYTVNIAQAKKELPPAVSSAPGGENVASGARSPAQQPVVFEAANTASAEHIQPSYVLSLTEDTVPASSKVTPIGDHLKVWSLLHRFQIPTSTQTGSILSSYPVIPTNCATSKSFDTTYFHNTKLSYLGALFKFWRGELEYRFDFIASKFHSCRVKIAWFPPATLRNADSEELPDAWTQVVDVQGQISTVFKVPYLQAVPYLPLDSSSKRTIFNGVVTVTLLNPVVYPTPQSSPINCIVWTRAPGCEFAGFCNEFLPPCLVLNGLSTRATDPIPMFGPDSIVVREEKTEKAPPASTPSKNNPKGKTAQAGASIVPVTLEQLSRKPSFVGVLPANGSLSLTPPMAETMPHGNVTGMRLRANTLLDYLSWLHLGFRGSVRVAVLNPLSEVLIVPKAHHRYEAEPSDKKVVANANLSSCRYTSCSYFPSSANSLKDVTLPCYTNLTYRPTCVFSNQPSEWPFTVPGITILNFSGSSSPVVVGAADDFSFFGMTPAPVTFRE